MRRGVLVVLDRFYKNDENDKIWWLESDNVGEYVFSFDKKKTYNLFQDYPDKLTQEEVEIFDKENSYWAEFFSDRK